MTEKPRTRFTPSTARRRLGEELRKARERAGLTLAAAAEHIERSAPTLSRLENGKAIPRSTDVKALLDRFAEARPTSVSDAVREQILALVPQAREQEWFTSFRDVLGSDKNKDDVARYIEFESSATVIKSYEPEIVPGLLQTRDYAAAVTEQFHPDRSDDERARLVEFRMKRKGVLVGDAALTLQVVIGELVLRRLLAPVDVTRVQLRHLLEDAERPNVDLRIAPLSLGISAAVGGPFVVMDLPEGEPDLVYLESREGAIYKHDEKTLERYRRDFAELLAAVPGPEESAELIRQAADAL